ncbi:MAG: phospholipid/cholesterol/gamma-HCH transport system permease protein [Thermodesulfobacteriota bacterium]|nr:phospholipid/cholesterol/gamma-HCH transport system permease protein [Thermodesulfobacteriota bacterium]
MTEATDNALAPCELGFDRPDQETLVVRLSGSWTLQNKCPSADRVLKEIASGPRVARIAFDAAAMTDWDSGFLIFLTRVIDACSKDGVAAYTKGLPEGARKLLALAATVPEKKGIGKGAIRASFLSRVGEETVDFFLSSREILDFIGEAFVAFTRFVAGKARFRGSDLTRILQDCGIEALPIVSLISLLVGLILAFVGAIQLMLFGAQIYVADLVGIAMVRVMGAVMTGIIMAGRTGAAFAAQLGTMEVNEEIDAFKTMGISPMEFLVLPRILGLTLMMPLLCLYADLMGILGGLIVGVGMLDLTAVEYYNETRAAVSLNNLWIGLFQSMVFGVLVAVAGCLRGMQCGRSASAVGDAATSAVVTGIVSIIVATAVITVVCNVLGI